MEEVSNGIDASTGAGMGISCNTRSGLELGGSRLAFLGE